MMKNNYDYVEFTYTDKVSFESFRKLFTNMQEYKNLSANEAKNYEDVDWEQFLTEKAKECFSHAFDFRSEEGRIYQKLWELTTPEIRTRSLKLIPPGPWEFESVITAIFNCDYYLVELEDKGEGNAILYLDFWAFPFGGMDSMWQLLQAYGFEINYDSYFEGKPPFEISQWDYALAKELVNQKKGLKD
ncbi:hypothetical protein GXP67_13360 [Rhodocytophaga rosea]|uniref:Uncharacterized protein n=1 Tax=Rhodocytophaga rosea TaxID=2704465 RepID=A0A6C0GIN6_9BACT|nr:hypothetical protein [Rhodocytophaga rosea]QHT67543.1 hypothetical protein GXP67_13360 [Rhodocytophaga rosea]